jgi:acyl-coenzyme A synthetase/AMP-(fatty) acid ligase
VTDAPDPPPADLTGVPAPRPGSLEHLARSAPDAPAVIEARTGRTLTRRRHDEFADALAAGLHAEHGIDAATRVAVALPPGADLLTLLFALAKLGAAPLLLADAMPVPQARALSAASGCALLVANTLPYRDGGPAGAPAVLTSAALDALAGRHADAPGRLSGEQPPADGLQVADGPDGPRVVVRARAPERLVRLAPVVGDLLARVDLPRGGTHLLAGDGHRPEPQFWAAVALVTGGAVVTLPGDDPGAEHPGRVLLDALVDHAVTSTVLDVAQLRSLLDLPAAVTDTADLTALGRVVVDDGPLDAGLVGAAADLFGDDVLHAVYATTQTGPVAHADATALAQDPTTSGHPLSGVTVTVEQDGLLVRSPLTADGALGDRPSRGDWPAPPTWQDAPVPTGDHGRLTDAGRVQVTRTAHPGDAAAA